MNTHNANENWHNLPDYSEKPKRKEPELNILSYLWIIVLIIACVGLSVIAILKGTNG
jgi:hypothetical protein